MDGAPVTGCFSLGFVTAWPAAPPSAARGSSTSGSARQLYVRQRLTQEIQTLSRPPRRHTHLSAPRSPSRQPHTQRQTHTYTHTPPFPSKGKTAFHVCFWLTALKDEPPLVGRIKRLVGDSALRRDERVLR